MKIFPKVVMLSVLLFMSIAAKNLVEVVTAVQSHFRSGCVYLLHEQKEGKSIFTFCVSTNELFSGSVYQEPGGNFGVNNALTLSIKFVFMSSVINCCYVVQIFVFSKI
jgi:hypothetical protein